MSGSKGPPPDSQKEKLHTTTSNNNTNIRENNRNEEDEGDRKPRALSPAAAAAAASSHPPTRDSQDGARKDAASPTTKQQSPQRRRRSSPTNASSSPSSRKRQRQEAASASEADDEDSGAESDVSVDEMAPRDGAVAAAVAAVQEDGSEEDASTNAGGGGDEHQQEAAAAAAAIQQQAHAVSVISVQEKWDEMFGRLVRFRSTHGHCLVPNRYKEDTSLGSWVATQRRTYKNLTNGGAASSGMNLDRARRLIEIGFEWSTTDPRHRPWEERYEELQAFVAVNGHAEVPMRWEENVQLSNWVSKQRQDYKLLLRGKTTRLTDKRRKLLNDVGFVWEIPRKGRRLRVAAKKIQQGASNGGVVISTSEGGNTTNTSLNSINTANPPGLASMYLAGTPAAAAAVNNQAALGPQQVPLQGNLLPAGLSLPAALQTALAGTATTPGVVPSSVCFATPAAGLGALGAAPGPEAAQSILGALGASPQNVHIANVVALAQLILTAQQQHPGASSLMAQQQQQQQAQQLTNQLLQQAAAAQQQPQGNAFMNMLQGAMQSAAAQHQVQQAAAAQPQQVSTTDLQSIATAIITAQLGRGAATGTPSAAAATSQVASQNLGAPSPSVASNATSSGLQQQAQPQVATAQPHLGAGSFGQLAQHVMQQQQQPGAAGNQPTFLVLPLQMNQAIQQLQAQQGLFTQPAAAPGALDINALASLGISPQQLGSLGLAPPAATSNSTLSNSLLLQQQAQAPSQYQLQMFQHIMQQQQQHPGQGGPQHLALSAQAHTAPQQQPQQENDASSATHGARREDPSGNNHTAP